MDKSEHSEGIENQEITEADLEEVSGGIRTKRITVICERCNKPFTTLDSGTHFSEGRYCLPCSTLMGFEEAEA